MRQVTILIGSNAPDRRSRIEAALQSLPQAGIAERRRSAVVAGPDFLGIGPEYLNVVVEGETPLDDDSLRSRFHALEDALGRRRPASGEAPSGVVAVDIDLVVADGRVLKHREHASAAFARCLATLG